MSSKPVLRIDWCSYEAAKYAVEHWHYSQRMPKSKLAKLGVWENDTFVGSVIFGVGATADLVKSYGLKSTEGCELVRVALSKHHSPVSRIVSIAIKMIRSSFPGLRLIVSFADPDQGHVGSIYQAMGWLFTGYSQSSDEYVVNGKRWHGRAFRASKPDHLTTKQALELMDNNFVILKGSSKYRYVYPLDNEIRGRILPLAKPYPKRAGSIAVDAPAVHAGEGGSTPTPALHEEAS